ncbi:MAG: hypothetical protein FJ278_09520 [Planctomycetes bacterium]|nr:hypothetical protein [Planctomycetota bacterium]
MAIEDDDDQEQEIVGEVTDNQVLSILLYSLNLRVRRRVAIGRKARNALLTLFVLCLLLVGLTLAPEATEKDRVMNLPAIHLQVPTYFMICIGPFLITLLHYFWISFAQIYYRAQDEIFALFDRPEFNRYGRLLDVYDLAEDPSMISTLFSSFFVEAGAQTALFRFFTCAIVIAPVAVQAYLSYRSLQILWLTDWKELLPAIRGFGGAVIYVLLLCFSLVQSISLFRFLRRTAAA